MTTSAKEKPVPALELQKQALNQIVDAISSFNFKDATDLFRIARWVVYPEVHIPDLKKESNLKGLWDTQLLSHQDNPIHNNP